MQRVALAVAAIMATGAWSGTEPVARGGSVAPASRPAGRVEEPPEAFTRVCGKCHDGSRIVETRRMRQQWEETLDNMVGRGATGSDEDFDQIYYYLVRTYGRVNVNAAPADEIAEVLRLDESQAAAIVRHRTEHGRFVDFEALASVPGVPVETLRASRDAIVF